MKRKKGSALIFVLIMTAVMSTAILASVQLSTSAGLLQAKREAETRARYAFEGAVQMSLTGYRQGQFTLPYAGNFIVGDHTVKLNISDNSSSIARTVLIGGLVKINDTSFKFTRVTGNRLDPNPFYYAVFVNGNLDPTKAITLGSAGANGDICVNGTIVGRSNAFVINGDCETTGTTLPFGASITGNTLKQSSLVSFPAVDKTKYLAAAILNLPLNAMSGYGFAVLDPYQLVYRNGNLDISGSFTGKGTIFVDGDVDIKGSVTYGNESSRLVVIATGRIRSTAGVKSIVGFWWAGTEFDNDDDLTVSSGSLVAPRFTMDKTLTVTHDPAFWNDPAEGVKHKVPGLWP